jgi:hypothetical protein
MGGSLSGHLPLGYFRNDDVGQGHALPADLRTD